MMQGLGQMMGGHLGYGMGGGFVVTVFLLALVGFVLYAIFKAIRKL